ncbi:MAG: YkgJ family cysteine cluster protein, partial [Deltaproteobacteria bacterium]|nr:YkgJ family cysteine cluster protein [Deltaproteobacteria bacterium]
MMTHPCLDCGACCATWAVQFERTEVTRALRPHVVPAATERHVILVGTEGEHPRCAALQGEVGERTRCAI